MTSRLDRSCLRCGTLDECRVHAPDGRTVDDHVDEHNGGAMILDEIAALYGCTKEAVRLWEECALMKAAALAHKLGSLEDHEPQLLAVGLQLPPCPVGGAS